MIIQIMIKSADHDHNIKGLKLHAIIASSYIIDTVLYYMNVSIRRITNIHNSEVTIDFILNTMTIV